MFALAVGVGQGVTRLELPQIYLLAGYSLLAVVASFFFDRYSGFTLAAFGLVIGAHILGWIGHMPKVIAGEVMLFAGMLFCGINGPSGGLFNGPDTVSRGGSDIVSVASPKAMPSSEASFQKD